MIERGRRLEVIPALPGSRRSCAIVFGVMAGWAGFAILFIVMSQGRRAKNIVTPWLDRLAAG